LPERQQLLGDPSGHVGQDQIGQIVVGAALPAGQHPQQLRGDLRSLSHHARNASRSIQTARTSVIVITLDVRGPGSKTDSCQTCPAPHYGERVLPPIGRTAHHLDLPGSDAKPIAVLALGEYRVPPR
jgi:hypothetical protein